MVSKKRKYLAFIVLTIATVILAYGFNQKISSHKVAEKLAECLGRPSSYPPTTDITGFDEITLEITGCFGPCAEYKVSIKGDGEVQYNGKGYVKTIGIVHSRLTSKQISEVIKSLNASGYFSIPVGYACVITPEDSPSAITSVTIGDKSHSINTRYGSDCAQLAAFSRTIESVVNIDQWIGTPAERKKITWVFQ